MSDADGLYKAILKTQELWTNGPLPHEFLFCDELYTTVYMPDNSREAVEKRWGAACEFAPSLPNPMRHFWWEVLTC